MERKTPRRLINPEPRIRGLELAVLVGGKGRDRLAILFSLSQSPLLSGPDTTERMGTSTTIYAGMSGDAPSSSMAMEPESGNFIPCPTSTSKSLCNLRQTLQHKSLQPLQVHMSLNLYSLILITTVTWASSFPSLYLSFLIYKARIRPCIARIKWDNTGKVFDQ